MIQKWDDKENVLMFCSWRLLWESAKHFLNHSKQNNIELAFYDFHSISE